MAEETYSVDVVDVSKMGYPERLAVISLQGLVNRDGPKMFLDYGIYDDASARETNEVFLPDDIWHEKFRGAIGHQDRKNLEYYQKNYPMNVHRIQDLTTVIRKYARHARGVVVPDPGMMDSINIAAMLSGLDSLLIVHPDLTGTVLANTELRILEDLRGRWNERVDLYRWAFKHLYYRCADGRVACIEPNWERPEFLDFIVQNRVFVYSLATQKSNAVFSLGQKMLLFLVAGPYRLRNLVFNARLDGMIKWLGLLLMGLGSEETRLATRILRSVRGNPFPTIFGWHTLRDDEFSFMVHLSAVGLRLVPSHLAGNFSFHSMLPSPGTLRQPHAPPESVTLEEDKIYLTFTLSDGDQLVLMNTAELGNWRREARGNVAFNWETQPLLVELAPALLGQYYESLTENDYLIAGPSGAGYVVPPLLPNLPAYIRASLDVCRKADIRVFTSYIGDPPLRVVKEHCRVPGDAAGTLIGYLGGYVHFGRTPQHVVNGRPFVCNQSPHVDKIKDDSRDTLEGVRKLIDAPGPTPRFIGVHLFAYHTTITDVYRFVQTLDPERVKVVRADEFLIAAAKHMETTWQGDHYG